MQVELLGFSLDDEEEGEDEQVELDGLKALKQDASKAVGKLAEDKKAPKDFEGFNTGGDLEKSLKDAKRLRS